MSDKTIEIWRTKSAMLASIVNAKTIAARIGRRGTKTFGIQGPRALRACQAMPGCTGAIAGSSYRKLTDILLPEIISSWQMMGLSEYDPKTKKGDYIIGKVPPEHWKPFISPFTWDNMITTKWRSAIRIISMDHGATAPNGSANDFLMLDEVKEMIQEEVNAKLMKTLSGHKSIVRKDGVRWGELPEHRSLTLTTDGYYGKRDHKWIEHFIKEASNPHDIKEIIAVSYYLQKNYSIELERYLWDLQKKATLYLNASSLESLALLGPDFFIDALKNSTPLEFRASILNEDVKEIEGGFYTLLDESLHTYKSKTNYNILDNIGMDKYVKGHGKNCRLDDDWKPDEELHLSLDYGADYSWAVVMQKHMNTLWLIKNFWVETPAKFTDMVEEFCEYYRPHVNKVVRLYDDPGGHREKTDTHVTDVEKVVMILRRNGWSVKRVNQHNRYIRHHKKYRIVNYILDESTGRDNRYPHFKCNLNNAYEAYWSMAKAPLKRGGKMEFQKDKRSEVPKPGVPMWQATHLSDAVDNIFCFLYEHLLEGKTGRISIS